MGELRLQMEALSLALEAEMGRKGHSMKNTSPRENAHVCFKCGNHLANSMSFDRRHRRYLKNHDIIPCKSCGGKMTRPPKGFRPILDCPFEGCNEKVTFNTVQEHCVG